MGNRQQKFIPYKMKALNALVLAQDFPPIPGGVSVYIENLYKNWKGPAVILAPDSSDPLKTKFPNNITIKRLPMDLRRGGLKPYVQRQIRLYWASLDLLKKEKFKYIHCTHIASGLVALILKRIHSIPYVLYTYGSEITGQPGFIRSNLAKLILRNAHYIITMSEFTKKAIMNYGIPDNKIRFLVGVEVDRFSKNRDKLATKEKYNIDGDPILLTVARLVEHKGIDTVIKALPEIIKLHPKLTYLVVGEGPYRSSLEKLSNELQVGRHVIFLGNIPHNKLQTESEAFYSICDLFVMVSRNIDDIEAEGFGIVFLEAGLSRKACIGGNSGGISDAVIDGVTGQLVDPNDPGAVATGVLGLLENREAANQMGKNGYERAFQYFNWQTNVSEWEKELNDLNSKFRQ
jgi:phosphatidylinositol alpha-1,6-mannosyltransferase